MTLAGFDFEDLDGNAVYDNTHVESLLAYSGYLYAFTNNQVTGNLTWRSRDGVYWSQLTPVDRDTPPGGFSQSVQAAAVLDGRLYLGLTGSLIWQMKPRLEVFKTGDGSGVITSLPAGIDCGPLCSLGFPASAPGSLVRSPGERLGLQRLERRRLQRGGRLRGYG